MLGLQRSARGRTLTSRRFLHQAAQSGTRQPDGLQTTAANFRPHIFQARMDRRQDGACHQDQIAAGSWAKNGSRLAHRLQRILNQQREAVRRGAAQFHIVSPEQFGQGRHSDEHRRLDHCQRASSQAAQTGRSLNDEVGQVRSEAANQRQRLAGGARQASHSAKHFHGAGRARRLTPTQYAMHGGGEPFDRGRMIGMIDGRRFLIGRRVAPFRQRRGALQIRQRP